MQIIRRSSFIFKENHASIKEEENPSDKVVMVEEELDDIDIDDIKNLVDLARLMFIDEEIQNLKVVIESFRSSRPEVFCKKSVLRNFAKFT